MRLSDAGLRCREAKAVYPDHRLPPRPSEDATPRSLEPIVRPGSWAMSLRICATFTNAIPTAHGKKYGIENTFSRSTGRPEKRNVANVIHGTNIAAIRNQTGTRVKSDALAATPASIDTPTNSPPTSPEKRNMTPYHGATTNISAPTPLRSELGMTIETMYRAHPTLGSNGSWRKEAMTFKRGLTMSLSDAGLHQRQTKALDLNHRSPPWLTEDVAPRSLQPIVRPFAVRQLS
jgi:hypothetical protein